MDHEVLDDAMELGALITETFGTGGQLVKVLDSLWDGLAKETNLNGTDRLTTNGHIEENLNTNT